MKISFKQVQLPLSAQQLVGPLSVLLIMVICHINAESWSTLANFNRTAIIAGEYWRIVTGHFFHTNTAHLLLNFAGLFMLWLLHGQYYTVQQYVLLMVVLCTATSLFILGFSPDLKLYVGLSGVLHGVFVFGSLNDIREGEKTGYVLLLGLTLKVLHEQLYGPSADVSALINANVAIDAHMWGAIAGGIYSLFYFLWNQGIQRKA